MLNFSVLQCDHHDSMLTKWSISVVNGCLVILVISCCFAVDVDANDDYESLADISRAIYTFLSQAQPHQEGEEIQITVDTIDSRLRLARCQHVPQIAFAPGAQADLRTTVEVSCRAPVTWSIFVPARIERYDGVVVIARPVERGALIRSGDVQLERRLTSTLFTGYFTDINAVVGRQAKRALTPGQVMTDALVIEPVLIERGQLVMLIAEHAGISVRMTGEALEDGVAGQRIRVRNKKTKRIIEGRVEENGVIRIITFDRSD
jgi:flagella basal body P-ring formation protein FlgA